MSKDLKALGIRAIGQVGVILGQMEQVKFPEGAWGTARNLRLGDWIAVGRLEAELFFTVLPLTWPVLLCAFPLPLLLDWILPILSLFPSLKASFRVFLRFPSLLLPQGNLTISFLLILRRFTIVFVTATFRIAFEIQNLH